MIRAFLQKIAALFTKKSREAAATPLTQGQRLINAKKKIQENIEKLEEMKASAHKHRE